MNDESLGKNATRILVVDDELAIQRYLKNALGAQGYFVQVAGNGKEGMNAALALRPDLIILDLGLPDMDGLEVLRRLREWTQTPILILSVRDREDERCEPLTMERMITSPSLSESESFWRECALPSENRFLHPRSPYTKWMGWKSTSSTGG